MRTIFDRLVEDYRAWHLFEDVEEYPPAPDYPGAGLTDYGRSPGYGRELMIAPQWLAARVNGGRRMNRES